MPACQPPFQLTHRNTALVADIAERLGAWKAANRDTRVLALPRSNRIRTLQASLAISRTHAQRRTGHRVLAGKPVLGSPKGVQEVATPWPPPGPALPAICCQKSANY
jgi:hypothetical protein